MNNIELYNNFCFLKVNYHKSHYTDNRQGSPYHYFAYLEKGQAKIVSKGKTILINEGDFFYIPKNLGYQSYWDSPDEISFFSYGCYNLFANDAIFLDLQVIKCPRELALPLIAISTTGTNVLTHSIGSFFSAIATILPYMDKANVSTAKTTLMNAKKYLNDNPYCSNTQLAEICHISLPYLYKLFKTHDNTTPNIYRQKVLCDKANELLITTDLPIEQISNILNFSSSGYFRKIFKEHTGQTPRDFRKFYSF